MTLAIQVKYPAASLISMAAALCTCPVWASDMSAAQAETTVSGQQAAAAPSDLDVVTDIIVTAQRRKERNQDVPIAITAFSNERLQQQNVSSGQDLNGVVPSLYVSSAGQVSRDVASYTLRGQGATYQGASAVVVYLNEVPLINGFTTAQQGGPGNYIDLENMQVLAGPQGTLFGRNTTGGAVLLVPHKPTNEFGGYVQGSIGNYDYRGVEGVINIPVVEDKLMVRAVGSYQDRDGYTHDVVWNKDRDNMHWYSGRIGITFKPTERIENYLLAFGAKSRTNGSAYIHRGFNIPGLQAAGACSDLGTPGIASCDVYRRQTELQEALGKRQVRYDVDEFEQSETWGLTNTTNFELTDELTLRNIFSYQRFKMNFADDYDATPLQQSDLAPINLPDFPVSGLTDEFGLPTFGYLNEAASGPRDNLRQITEELQLQGDMLDKHLTFTVGAFYYHQKPVSDQLARAISFCPAAFTGLCAPSIQTYGVTNKSRALYGQATLDLGAFSPALEKLRLTGGYRYTWDTIRGFSNFYLPGINPADPSLVLCLNTITTTTDPSTCQFGATLKSKAPTWRLGVDYQAMANLLLFATVNRGYKAGGFNPYAVRPEARIFVPEKVTSYEAGLKSDWKLGSVPLRLNLTAYTMDYKNIQRAVGDANGSAIGAAFVPASARIRGVELETSIRPIRAVELGGNVSYTDAKFKEFNVTALAPRLSCGSAVPVAAGDTVDASCLDFGVPKWTYSAHVSADAPLPGDLGNLNFYANFAWIGRSVQSAPFFPEEQPGSRFSSYGLLNLSLSWQNIGQGGLDATLFMTNATNNLYKTSNSNTFQATGGTLAWAELYGEPRMYGLRLRYSFGE